MNNPPPLPAKKSGGCRLVDGCPVTVAVLVAGVALLFVLALGSCVWNAQFGNDDWADSIRYTLHIDPPKFAGGHVFESGLREEVRRIWVYGKPDEIRKLVNAGTMQPDPIMTIKPGDPFPSSVWEQIKPEDFSGVIPWRRDWPDSDPKGSTITWIWIHPNETSAVILFYSSTH